MEMGGQTTKHLGKLSLVELCSFGLEPEIIVDCFAGGGGVSTGVEEALGVSPDLAINHDAVAIAMHKANHPNTEHLNSNIFKVVPSEAARGRAIGMLWLSPDCKHFSKAKGAKPVEKRIRGLAWVALHWAQLPAWQKPRVIFLENVPEFVTWGPLLPNGRPDPDRRGEEFQKFLRALRREGYKRIEWRIEKFCNYGDPTIRTRLVLIARCDDEPIVWPAHTHGAPESAEVLSGAVEPWRTAADHVIDWSIPCPSIFLSPEEVKALYLETGTRVQRPLRPNTLARIFKGVVRYVIECADPFIVPVTHAGDTRAHSIREPIRTQTGAKRGEHALVVPFMVPRYGERDGQEPRTLSVEKPLTVVVPTGNGATLVAPHLMMMRNSDKPFNEADRPMHTITAGGARPHLVSAFLAQHNYLEPGHDAREPLSTIVGKGCTQAVVSAGLLNLKGSKRRGVSVEAPAPTITAQGGHLAEVRAFLVKFYKTGGQHQDVRDPLHTLTAKARMGLVTVKGEDYEIVDIGMRMLTPRERFNAHSFPPTYKIDIMVPRETASGTVLRRITAEEQGRMVGNSVPCRFVKAIVAANYRPRQQQDRRPAAEEFTLEAAE
ncbi:DNA (cytosine-5)-methyltransferase 1 [Bradyrhizobium brasilense]|uniref:DNA (cytosine-5-)-methyltransferase n=1 Tax=Bradyrhizobium brasilense TaxID=1419277 RepID=A0A1G6YTE8_9BRAD|nr:DNA cytosine methyltransferase [Bradyrhizobium brasilense]SDD93333.1 DNA (cytosine-5)-methyltransferase 1 [Bradyrhizobium brasilense]